MRLLGILILTLAAGVASGSELVLSGGFAPPRTTTEGSPAGGMFAADSSGMLLLNFGGNFFNFGSLALGYEIPPRISRSSPEPSPTSRQVSLLFPGAPTNTTMSSIPRARNSPTTNYRGRLP